VSNLAQVESLSLKASQLSVPGVSATDTLSKYCSYTYPETGSPYLTCSNEVDIVFDTPNFLVDPASPALAVKYASDFLGQGYNLLKEYQYSYHADLSQNLKQQLPPVAFYNAFNLIVKATPTYYYDKATKATCSLVVTTTNETQQHSAIRNGVPANLSVDLNCGVAYSGEHPYPIKN